MSPCRTVLAAAALIAAAIPAQAYRMPETNAPAAIPHVQDVRFNDAGKTPYAMNYTDEAAQTLGIKDGKWEAFSTKSSSPLMPSLKAGADSGGAMIKLQWQ
jgi:hypothetical protein